MKIIGRVSTRLVKFFVDIASLLTGMVGRVLLVAGSLACTLLLFDSLFSGLEWVFTHDRRALVDATGFLAEAAVPFAGTLVGAYYREKLRRMLETRRARKLAEAGPWSIG